MKHLEAYRQMHRDGHFKGGTVEKSLPRISHLIEMHQATTLLDYGSGKGEITRRRPFGPEVYTYLYDPAVRYLDKKPHGMFHGVICIDVLEHIPEEELDGVIGELDQYSSGFVYVTVCTRPAKKTLPTGENCHATIKPRSWWRDKLPEHWVVEFTE